MFSLANEYEQLDLMGKVSEITELPCQKPTRVYPKTQIFLVNPTINHLSTPRYHVISLL